LPAVEAVPGERFHQLGLLVGQVGEQDVTQDVGRFLQPVEALRAAQVLDQRGVTPSASCAVIAPPAAHPWLRDQLYAG
jgi:hypothetical protein